MSLPDQHTSFLLDHVWCMHKPCLCQHHAVLSAIFGIYSQLGCTYDQRAVCCAMSCCAAGTPTTPPAPRRLTSTGASLSRCSHSQQQQRQCQVRTCFLHPLCMLVLSTCHIVFCAQTFTGSTKECFSGPIAQSVRQMSISSKVPLELYIFSHLMYMLCCAVQVAPR